MKFLFALILLTLFSSVGCAQQSNGIWTTEDSWHNPPPNIFGGGEARELSEREWSVVSSGRWLKAQEFLKTNPIVPLSAAQARGFTGKTLAAPKGTQPYLVRAVYLNAATGGFSVEQSKTALLVSHYCLGRSAVPMKRSALVVFLKQRPATLFTKALMAE